MKRYLIFVGLLVLVAGLAISVALVTQDVGAYSSGWGDGNNCDDCHARDGGNNPHDISGHPAVSDSDSCSTCHDAGFVVSPSACLSCHPLSGDNSADGLATAHAGNGVDSCTASTACHGAATTTTTSESATTTTSESTTTTTGATTTTTEGVTTTTSEGATTSTTEGDSTTTTEAETTTTTVPTGEPDFTG